MVRLISDIRLTKEEAEKLLNMVKHTLVDDIDFPGVGKEIKFDAIGSSNRDKFNIHIYRSKIKSTKYNIGALFYKNDVMLMELHICDTLKHRNPDGQMIIGNHWHIYSEEYGRKMAIPAEDIRSVDFVENTLVFFEKFNLIEPPYVHIEMQMELF